jgi:hypothetical protein
MGWVLDMWRGYKDSDRASLEEKLAGEHPVGYIIQLTHGEYECWRSGDYLTNSPDERLHKPD